MVGEIFLRQRHLPGTPDEQGDPLVNFPGLDFPNRSRARGGLPPCLLHDQAHGGALIEQAQLAMGLPGVPGVGGIKVDTAFQENSVDVGHQASAVACGVGAPFRLVRGLQVFQESTRARMEVRPLSFVGGVNLAMLGNPDGAAHEHEILAVRIQAEEMRPRPGREDQSGGRTIIEVAGGSLVAPLLQERLPARSPLWRERSSPSTATSGALLVRRRGVFSVLST